MSLPAPEAKQSLPAPEAKQSLPAPEAEHSRVTGSALRERVPLDAPPPSFEHLLRLSDDTGVLEHARGPMPRRNHGYCVDDNARALLVISRETSPPAEVARLAERCLAFLAHAQVPDGRFHNRMGYGRRFEDEPGDGDWWGRALWGLGVAVASNPTARVRAEALTCFTQGCGVRSDHPRAMAYAALGAAAVADAHPGHPGALLLLADTAAAIGRPRPDASWPWPYERLTYGNATVAEALIAGGSVSGDDRLGEDGLMLLDWLLSTEMAAGHLSLTPVRGWAPGERRPAFDQQPIEAAAMADACVRAHDVTGDPKWLGGVDAAARWFLGDNDVGVPMFDAATGGGYDGLEEGGRNANQGAESTLAFISTMQWARMLDGPSPPAPEARFSR